MDRVLDDRTVEIDVEICPGSARKSDVESHGHIPLGHASIDEWKRIFLWVLARSVSPISVLIWAIDFPYGSICVAIRAVEGVKGGECGRQLGGATLEKIRRWRKDSTRHVDVDR